MNIHACKYVNASDLFTRLRKLWTEFCASDPDFSWGGNNHSLVDGDAILNHLDNSAIDSHKQVETLRKRINLLPEHTYIDLEN